MKKLLSIMLLLAPLALAAQGIGIGIKAGANFADADIKSYSVKSAASFLAGAYVNLNLSEKFGITPEVLWTGYKSDVEGDLSDVEFNRDYLSIPIMLRYKPISLISLEVGPQFNLLMNADLDGDDIKKQLKSNEFGMAFGAGVHLPLGFNAGLRYIIGFTNISDADPSSIELPDDIKNRTFQIHVGWTLFGAK